MRRLRRRKTHALFRLVQRLSTRFDARVSAAGRLIILAAIVTVIFALDPRQTTAYQFAAVLLGILCVAYVGTFIQPAKLSLKRQLPQYLTVGEPGEYTVQLSNETAKLVRDIAVKDCLQIPDQASFAAPPNNNTTGRQTAANWWERTIGFIPWLRRLRIQAGARLEASDLFSIAPHEKRAIKLSIMPLRRGYIYFSGFESRKTETLGLLRKVKFHPQTDKIIALPSRVALPTIQWLSHRRLHRGGLNLAASVGDSQEFIGLRDYRPGDSLRQIHWRNFAKLGKPVIKEFQDEYFDHHALVLNTRIADGQEALFESAVSAAASFINWTSTGDSLLDLVVVGDRSWRVTAGRGINHKSQLLEHLAVVEAKYASDDGTEAIKISGATKACSTVVLITCDWDFATRRSAELIRQQGSKLLAIQIVASHLQEIEPYQARAGALAADLSAILLNYHTNG